MEYNEFMKELKTEKEEMEKVKTICTKYNLPSVIFESLVEKDNKVFLNNNIYDVIKNFYIMYRYFTLKDIYDNSSFLLMEPKELYSKINTLINNNISLKKLFTLDIFSNFELRSQYFKEKASNRGLLNKEEVNKYKFVYLMSIKGKTEEIKELEKYAKDNKENKITTDVKEEKKTVRITPLYEFFPKYSKEEVDHVVSNLSESNKKLLRIAFGKDFENPVRGKEWNESYIRLNFRGLMLRMDKELERQRKVNKKPLPFTFYDHFKDFSHEEVDKVIDSLDEREMALLIKAFGIGLTKAERSKYWNKKDSEALKKFMLDFLIKLFDNRKKEEMGIVDEPTTEEKVIEEVEDNIIEKTDTCITFDEYLKRFTFIDLCNLMGEDNARIVAMKLGLFSKRKYKEVEIAAFLNRYGGKYSSKNVYDIYNSGMDLLKDKYRAFKFKEEFMRERKK